MALKIHLRKVTIIAERVLRDDLLDLLKRHGASGWTITAGDEPADYFSGDPSEVTQIVGLGELVQRYPALVEVFQADGWSGWQSAPDDMLDLYQVTCRARECPSLPVHTDDIEAVRQCILELTASWEQLPVGEALTLSFGLPDNPWLDSP